MKEARVRISGAGLGVTLWYLCAMESGVLYIALGEAEQARMC